MLFFGLAYQQGKDAVFGKSISNGAQYGTPYSEIYCEKVKMCRFSSGNWFFCTRLVQLAVAVAGKGRNTAVDLPPQGV
jgi:hypothetical protein